MHGLENELPLDTGLIEISDATQKTYWTVRDSVEGLQIFGGIGSGKTSGSGRTFALKFLEHGYGGLVLTAKHDEKDLWQEYCRLTGRIEDLVIVEPGGAFSFNLIAYEASRAKDKQALTINLVQVLKTVIRANKEKSSSRTDDAFWETALDMLLANTIDLCLLAYGSVTLQLLYEIAQTAPKKLITKPDAEKAKDSGKPNAFANAYKIAMAKIKGQVDEWKKTLSFSEKAAIRDDYHYTQLVSEAQPDVRRMNAIASFFNHTYYNLAEKTRSIVDFSLLGFLYNLLREPTYSLFSRYTSNFIPEDCLGGKIILLNLPVKDYHKMGQDSQIMFKYVWQRSMERRRVNENGRPVFLWADEAQHFLHEHDADYQATARSSRIATVYISQNLPNYYANMGGQTSEYKVKSFLGTLGTKIFHANADIETNEYASRLIGQAYMERRQISSTIAGDFSSTEQLSYELEAVFRPEQFVGLRTGGPGNDYQVDGIMHMQGKRFSGNQSHKKLRFNQHYKLQ